MTVLADEPAAPAECVNRWQQALSRAFARVEVAVPDPAAWTASLSTHRLGALQITDETSGPATVLRSTGSVAADPRRHVLARLQLEGTVHVSQDDRSAELPPGSLTFLDLGRAFRIAVPVPQCARTLMVPRPLLGLDENALRQFTATRVDPGDGDANALLLPLLTGIGREISGVAVPVQDHLARTAADLLAVLAADHAARLVPGTRPPTQSLFDRITASVEASLSDPDLSPQVIADQNGVSLRYLHQLFQRQGSTVSGWIRGRRLDAAHQELARPDAARREISAVAARWGFTNASHFSRAFREAYGMSPIQWRGQARGRPGP
ncbi:helix-turn-helix domain-containing protein [Actinoallomurus vinaceus]|uniref:Helix-turn-helix domain-containing protein n=1 Tax=Actinoallomurus vinaceus TaxID=1080074 RepID=A0ABP8U4J4_9ACTN